ncbi:MAG: SIMPL domain-containing protein [Alicyclobacillus sp.]|nr:SIMPL domain-containing protein [Alicyclobacillus sp.]
MKGMYPGRTWKRRAGLLAAGTGLSTWLVSATLCNTAAMAMPVPANGNMDILQANTIIVTGVAEEPIPDPVTVLSYNLNIQDDSMKHVLADVALFNGHVKSMAHRLGLPPGDVILSPANFNSGGNGPSASLSVNFVISDASRLSDVAQAMVDYSPSFVQNTWSSSQVVPLNPNVAWKPLYDAAIANAKQQAEALAKYTGKALGPILSISTVPSQGGNPVISGPYPTSPSVDGMQYVYNNTGQLAALMTQLYVCFSLVPKGQAKNG